ncbi:trypsin-like serine peptidase [Thermobifida cellulosilytica]|uniref:Serine protease n=1 Tax=Thermobifida cellulosilytica TB100 TaxID=665004 RepID=A0A147KE05_THECS|nr:trypsin-like serine protease [Thermobifida cellulosilytica]KUP95479.1 serine protease [Thermobifida cellulosilytica TB100]
MNRSIVYSILASFTLAVLGASPASAVEPSAPEGTATASSPHVVRQSAATTPQQRRSVLEYWTTERMASATPLSRGIGELDVPLFASPRSPESADAGRGSGSVRRWTGGGLVAATTGRVYLTLDGVDYTCTASVIDAENRDTVLTAGHCLKDKTGSWAENWIFVPGYTDGREPYGRYSARDMLVSPKWSRQGDDSYDFGLVVLNTDLLGRHVADRTGSQQVSFDGHIAPRVYAFGYPSSSPYSGRHLYYCAGPTHPDRNGTHGSGMDCAMTQGSSGGPWFANFDPSTGIGTITSLISFKYADNPDVQYGPRLGEEARRVYQAAQTL